MDVIQHLRDFCVAPPFQPSSSHIICPSIRRGGTCARCMQRFSFDSRSFSSVSPADAVSHAQTRACNRIRACMHSFNHGFPNQRANLCHESPSRRRPASQRAILWGGACVAAIFFHACFNVILSRRQGAPAPVPSPLPPVSAYTSSNFNAFSLLHAYSPFPHFAEIATQSRLSPSLAESLYCHARHPRTWDPCFVSTQLVKNLRVSTNDSLLPRQLSSIRT